MLRSQLARGPLPAHARALSTSTAPSSSNKSILTRIKEYFELTPNMPPYANFPIQKQERGIGFRNPSPGSPDRGVPSIPLTKDENTAYDTQYYTRDARRNQPKMTVYGAPHLRLGDGKEPPLGSPGKHIPAVARYDPTGTRAAMTTTHKAVQAELAKHTPDHLPTSYHEKVDPQALQRMRDEHQAKGIPPFCGVYGHHGFAEVKGNEGRW